MFRQCGQGLCREERQGCYNKDNSKSHDSKGHRIGFQRTSTFRNVSFLSQQSGQSYLADNRNETAQDQYNATGKIPEPGIVTQAFESRSVIGRTRGKLIKHFSQSMGTRIVEPSAFTRHKSRGMNIQIGSQSRSYQDDKRMQQRYDRSDFISRASTLWPMNSGVRPTINPLINTAMMRNVK